MIKKLVVLWLALAGCGLISAAINPLQVEVFSSGTTAEKLALLDRIIAAHDKVYLPQVAALLDDSAQDVRRKASEALLLNGDVSCVSFFRKALDDPWYQVRLNGAKGLVRFGAGDVLPALVKAEDDSYWQVRSYAAVGLGKFGDETVLQPLIAHGRDANQQVREEVLWAITRLLWRDQARADFKKMSLEELQPVTDALASPAVPLRIRGIWVLEAAQDPKTIPLLVERLDDDNVEVKIRAVWALEHLRATEASGAIEGLLAEPSVKLKLESIKTLVRLKADESVNGLVRRLHDPAEQVRMYALWALERFDQPETYPDIVGGLADSSEAIREYSFRVVDHSRSAQYIPVLESFAAATVQPIESRVSALQLLGRIGDAGTKEYLTAAARDPEEPLRRAASAALYAVDHNDPATLKLLCVLQRYDDSPSVRATADRLLGDAISSIGTRLRSSDSTTRQAALDLTNSITGTPRLHGLLKSMAHNQFPEVREKMAVLAARDSDPGLAADLEGIYREPDVTAKKAAALALGEIRAQRAVPLLRQGLKSTDDELRLDCAWALARLGKADGVPVALTSLQSSQPDVQKRAVEVFGYLRDDRGASPLLRLLGDAELEVKATCAWALARLGERKGVEVLVKLSLDTVEPVRTQASRYLEDPVIVRAYGQRIAALRAGFAHAALGAPERSPKIMRAYRAGAPIEIDGKDADRIWRQLSDQHRFLLVAPEAVPADVQTKAYAAFDDTMVYFLIICEDPQAGSLTINSRDFITVAVSPTRSAQRWYQFVLHPLKDVHYSYVWKWYSAEDRDRSWTSNWKWDVTVESSRWVAELAIPLSDLAVTGIKPGDTWAVNFQRESDALPLTTWTGRIDRPEQFGALVFEEQP